MRAVIVLLLLGLTGCLVVPKSRQRYLNDPTMKASESPLEDRARRKIHTAREGAGGGDGEPAGGGCACGN